MCPADIDATLVSRVKRDGPMRGGAPSSDGVTLAEARRRKERTYPQLHGVRSKARLFVLAGEVVSRHAKLSALWLCRRSLLHTSPSFKLKQLGSASGPPSSGAILERLFLSLFLPFLGAWRLM